MQKKYKLVKWDTDVNEGDDQDRQGKMVQASLVQKGRQKQVDLYEFQAYALPLNHILYPLGFQKYIKFIKKFSIKSITIFTSIWYI